MWARENPAFVLRPCREIDDARRALAPEDTMGSLLVEGSPEGEVLEMLGISAMSAIPRHTTVGYVCACVAARTRKSCQRLREKSGDGLLVVPGPPPYPPLKNSQTHFWG